MADAIDTSTSQVDPTEPWPVIAVSDEYGSQYLEGPEFAPEGAQIRRMTPDNIRSWIADGDCPDWVARLV